MIRRIGQLSHQLLYALTLVVYPAAVVAAAENWQLAFALLGLATFGVEAVLPARATVPYGLLRLAGAGWTLRSVVRSFAVVLLVAVAFHSTAVTLTVAACMLAIEGMRASQHLLGLLVTERRKLHMVTRNLDISAMGIPDRSTSFADRIDARGMSYLGVAPLLGVIVTAATGSRYPIIVGALFAVVLGLGIVGLTTAHAMTSRKMPRKRAVTSVIKKQLADYAPDVAIYFSGSATSAYQINMWLEVAARLDQRVLIVVRERPTLAELGPSTLPVLCVPSAIDLMDLDIPTVRVALYPANTGKNIHFLRLPGMAHIFIGHGDSDKIASINPFCKVYDEVWVAGPAGRERFARALIGVDDADVFEVGRPQLAPIERGPRSSSGPITVLYAPTWEGWTDDPLNTSLITMGRTIVAAILGHPYAVRLIYKPHPLTGTRSVKAAAENEAIIAMIDKANEERASNAAAPDESTAVADVELAAVRAAITAAAGNADADEAMVARDSGTPHPDAVLRADELAERWTTVYWASRPEWSHRVVSDALPTLFDCFNHTDLLVTDISSVVADYLYSEKPYVVTNSAAVDHDVFRNRYPTAAAAELLDPDCAALSEIITSIGAGADRLTEQRRKLKEHLLGADDQLPFERFREAINRVIATVASAPRPDWDNSEFEPEPEPPRAVFRLRDAVER